MFRPARRESEYRRVLIASSTPEDRRQMSDIARAADLRAVGFIRDAQQVIPRTVLSLPDVLLLDIEVLLQMQEENIDPASLSAAASTVVVLFGRQLKSRSLSQFGIRTLRGIVDLSDSCANGDSALFGRMLSDLLQPSPKPVASPTPARVVAPTQTRSGKRMILPPNSVVIGSSTGGPVALLAVLKGLPAHFPLPIAVVQHMPPGFTRMLAERLDTECSLRVVEAEEGMPFEAGTVYIAPGSYHMLLEGSRSSPSIHLSLDPPENYCRPAVDVLFRSSAKVYGGKQHVIVLTGMGRDGLLGANYLHGLGSRIVVQDAATSTVWGMPGAIAQAGLADDILSLDQIAPQLLRCI